MKGSKVGTEILNTTKPAENQRVILTFVEITGLEPATFRLRT